MVLLDLQWALMDPYLSLQSIKTVPSGFTTDCSLTSQLRQTLPQQLLELELELWLVRPTSGTATVARVQSEGG